MAHLPYARTDAPELEPLVRRIVAERGSLLHLYQMLLHSPKLAEAWLAFFTVVRQQLALPGDLRELVIMQVAHLNGAPYEAEQHAPIALKEGLTREQLDALPHWQASAVFSPLQRAALALTDAMTRDIHVEADVVAALREHLDEGRVLELVVTVASYAMVSRVLEGLHIRSADAR